LNLGYLDFGISGLERTLVRTRWTRRKANESWAWTCLQYQPPPPESIKLLWIPLQVAIGLRPLLPRGRSDSLAITSSRTFIIYFLLVHLFLILVCSYHRTMLILTYAFSGVGYPRSRIRSPHSTKRTQADTSEKASRDEGQGCGGIERPIEYCYRVDVSFGLRIYVSRGYARSPISSFV